MGRLTELSDIRAAVLAAVTPPPLGHYPEPMRQVKHTLVVADDQSRFMVMRTGWYNGQNFYGTMQDVELLNGQVIIHLDSGEDELFEELVEAGVDPAIIVKEYKLNSSDQPVTA